MSEDTPIRNLDLIEVIKIARNFAELAGWGYFRVGSLMFYEKVGRWILTAYLGAMNDQQMYIFVHDVDKKVTQWTTEKPEIFETE